MSKNRIRNQILNDMFGLLWRGVATLLVFGVGGVLWAQSTHLERYANALAQRFGPEVRSYLVEGRRSDLRSYCDRANGIQELVSLQIVDVTSGNQICDVSKTSSSGYLSSWTLSSRKVPIAFDHLGMRPIASLEFTLQDSRLIEQAVLLLVLVLAFLLAAAFAVRMILHRQFRVHLQALEELSSVLASGGAPDVLAEKAGRVDALSLEVESLRAAMIEYSRNLKSLHETELREKMMSMHRDLLRQVTHDIRSPLSALKMIAFSKKVSVEAKAQDLMVRAIGRIEDQLRNAMIQSKEPSATLSSSFVSVQSIQQIVRECGALFESAHPDIKWVYGESLDCDGVYVAEEGALRMILMNAVSNSLCAIQNKKEQDLSYQPLIQIDLILGTGDLEIRVADNGSGIPEEKLPLVGIKGFSYGKMDGNGLGVWSAKQNVASWGGRYSLESEAGKSCHVSIVLIEKSQSVNKRLSS